MKYIALGLQVAAMAAGSAMGQTIQLSSPNATPGGHFGDAVAVVPDVDGDGIADVVVGAPYETVNGFSRAGRVYLVSGWSGAVLRHISPPNDEASQEFGECVAGVPDIDGDGFGDILVGSPGADPDLSPNDSGRAYLYSGATGVRLQTFISPAAVANGAFGDDVAVIGDLDGDLLPDVLIGAPGEATSIANSGRVYVFSSATGLVLRILNSPNPDFGGDFGDSVAAVPDVNGDGIGDILVGAPFENPVGSPVDCGRAYIFSGATGALLRQLQSPAPEAGGGFGEAILGVSDLNGDGRGEVVVGAPRENPNNTPADCGRVHIYSGATGAFITRFIPPAQQPGGNFGYALAAMPDRNGDGLPEIIVGAWKERIVVARPGTVTTAGSSPAAALGAVAMSGSGGLSIASVEQGRIHVYAGGTWVRLGSAHSPAATTQGHFGRAVGALRRPNGSTVLLGGASGEGWSLSTSGAGRAYLLTF